MHELFERTGAEQGRRWSINRAPIVVGRSAQCDIRVSDAVVSRKHCEIWESDAGIILRDLGSSNASLVNGEPAREAVLTEGDEITIGDHVFVVVSADTANDFVERIADDPTPITVSLSESQYALDNLRVETRDQQQTTDGFRALLAFSRQLSRIESVTELLDYFERFLVEHFKPQALWVVTFRGAAHKAVRQRMSGAANDENLPLDAMQRAAQQLAGLLVPTSRRQTEGSGLETLMVSPLTIGNEAIGAIAANAAVPHGVFDESDLEFFVAVAHTFAPYFRALERTTQLQRDYERSDAASNRSSGLVGTSIAMEQVRDQLRRAAATSLNVLLCGETGTGKELAARMIHDESSRADGPYVVVNCAAIPGELFESEMFGHEQGSFTGATRRKIGRFEEAHGGTLFLDEIGDLSDENQAGVLRAIELGSFNRVGGPSISVDVRVIAATNKLTFEGSQPPCMRPDLYHRLSGFEIHLPALRDHRDDMAVLADHFIHQFNIHSDSAIQGLSAEALQALREWYWPGNVRELRACIERAAALASGETIQIGDILIRETGLALAGRGAAPVSLAEAEKNHIMAVLRYHKGNIRAAARTLAISRTTLYKKIEDYGIDT